MALPMISFGLALAWLCTGALLSLACIDSERLALLRIRQSLDDPSMDLSSWNGTACCRWPGVHCQNGTGPVVELNLDSMSLGGKLSPSLLELRQLRSLNLSINNFNGSRIPDFFGAFPRLKYLDISNSNFGGLVPHQLGNLSALLYLDIGSGEYASFPGLMVDDLSWVSRLSSLQYLGLVSVNLRRSTEWLLDINKLTRLSELRLSATGPPNIPLSIRYLNLTSLTVLDISNNDFNSPLPHWLSNMSNLNYLDLSASSFVGTIPDVFNRMNSLSFVSLKINRLHGEIPKSMAKLCSLESLDLSWNNITGQMAGLVDGLSQCNSNSGSNNLTLLNLSHNIISRPIPPSIEKFPSLVLLYLQTNNMSGNIPEGIGQLSNLGSIDVSSNMFVGDLTEVHFENLKSLKELSISYNSFTLKVSSNWSPPFQLNVIHMPNCRVGPLFPKWLRTQKNFNIIKMSNASISDTIPIWFWNVSSQISYLNFSTNKISGRLPPSLEFISISLLDMSLNVLEGPLPLFNSDMIVLNLYGNSLSGQLPSNMGAAYPTLRNLLLAKNIINGAIPESICEMESLEVIGLSDNLLSGELPNCWRSSQILAIMDLANNNISGGIPSSLGSMISLKSLHLNNNSLSGELPTSLLNCTGLVALDLGENKLSGNISSWLGKNIPSLMILRLRSNHFSGAIPDISLLSSLRVLDLGNNSLSGSLPVSFGGLEAMKVGENSGDLLYAIWGSYEDNVLVFIKGRELQYSKILKIVTSIDFSSNRLDGDIPDDLTSLLGLHVLNFSQNMLSGGIPKSIGKLTSLESLDLSRNRLSGFIPPSISALNYLSKLNLSYNNLQGRLPTGSQLQTFDELAYIGNPKLCGTPLRASCQGDDSQGNNRTESTKDEESSEMKWFYAGLAPGFAVGFCILWGAFLSRGSLRSAYITIIDKTFDRISTTITSKL